MKLLYEKCNGAPDKTESRVVVLFLCTSSGGALYLYKIS